MPHACGHTPAFLDLWPVKSIYQPGVEYEKRENVKHRLDDLRPDQHVLIATKNSRGTWKWKEAKTGPIGPKGRLPILYACRQSDGLLTWKERRGRKWGIPHCPHDAVRIAMAIQPVCGHTAALLANWPAQSQFVPGITYIQRPHGARRLEGLFEGLHILLAVKNTRGVACWKEAKIGKVAGRRVPVLYGQRTADGSVTWKEQKGRKRGIPRCVHDAIRVA
ncbi:unnamed protein product, partial [Mesorhabditis spiculigera]